MNLGADSRKPCLYPEVCFESDLSLTAGSETVQIDKKKGQNRFRFSLR